MSFLKDKFTNAYLRQLYLIKEDEDVEDTENVITGDNNQDQDQDVKTQTITFSTNDQQLIDTLTNGFNSVIFKVTSTDEDSGEETEEEVEIPVDSFNDITVADKTDTQDEQLDECNDQITEEDENFDDEQLDECNKQLDECNKQLDECNKQITEEDEDLDDDELVSECDKQLDECNDQITEEDEDLDDDDELVSECDKLYCKHFKTFKY